VTVDVQRLGERPKHIWQDAVVRWPREQSHKASINDNKKILRWLHPHLADRELESINRALIEKVIEAKQAEGSSNGTVKRVPALMRNILRRCERDWEWIDRAPAFRLLKEPTRRIRYLTQEQAVKLLLELPTHLRDVAAFALAVGLRRANITGLTWKQVDLRRKLAWVHPDQAKVSRGSLFDGRLSRLFEGVPSSHTHGLRIPRKVVSGSSPS